MYPRPVSVPALSGGRPSSQPLQAAQLSDALLRIQTVCAVTGLSASSVYRKVADRTFPSPIRLGARCTRFRSADVSAWVRAQGGDAA
jgi:prophage regulatory protein